MKKTFLSSLLLLAAFASFAQKTKVAIETTAGKIVVMLYDGTPQHRANFIKLAKAHFFDSTLFHRVIPGFMIQGGDPTSKHAAPGAPLGDGDVGYTIPAEINNVYFHKRGALAAARDENPQKASSGCQFYIVTGRVFTDAQLDDIERHTGRKYTQAQREVYKTIGGAPHLDGNYTVFGEVTEGMDVADKIANAPRNSANRPDKDIRMIKVRVIRKKFLGLF